VRLKNADGRVPLLSTTASTRLGAPNSNEGSIYTVTICVNVVMFQRWRHLAWRLWRAPTEFMERHVRVHRLRYRIRHIHGPEKVEYGPEELLAICVVRNGGLYIHSFVDHHFQLGVRHIVFLDNGSTDDTVEIASQYPNVTILTCDLPYRKYENVMKRYLARRFSRNRWNLCVDVDELFEFPHSNLLSLSDFLAYLNRNGYTSVIAHMLDMFGDKPLAQSTSGLGGDLRETCSFFDISNVSKSEYVWSPVPDDRIKMYWGGIRKTLFGTKNGLSKAALVHVTDEIDLFVDWHHVSNAQIADVTAVLLHFPFTGSFVQKVLDAVQTGRYGYRTTTEYRSYWSAIQYNQNYTIWSETAQRLTDLNILVEQGFLIASNAYRKWALATRQNAVDPRMDADKDIEP